MGQPTALSSQHFSCLPIFSTALEGRAGGGGELAFSFLFADALLVTSASSLKLWFGLFIL